MCANSAAPRNQKYNSFALSPSTTFRAFPILLTQPEIIARKHTKAANPPPSPSATYWLEVSHISHPHVPAAFVPISHQSPTCLINASTSSARWSLEDEPNRLIWPIRNQTGAFI